MTHQPFSVVGAEAKLMPGVRRKGVPVPVSELLVDPEPVAVKQGIQLFREIHPEIQTANDLVRVPSVVHQGVRSACLLRIYRTR